MHVAGYVKSAGPLTQVLYGECMAQQTWDQLLADVTCDWHPEQHF